MKIAVIVVTYNSARFLEDCFGSLGRLERDRHEVEVIAVDNASTDGTVAAIRERWPQVTLIENRENLMFAGGNNLGIRRAIEQGADFVYLLNHDTEVAPDFLVEAVKAAEAEPRAGAVQSLLLLSPEKNLINSTGNAIHFLGFGYCNDYRVEVERWKGELRDSQQRVKVERGEIAYASGAGVLLRVAALREVGLLDETLQHYHEDLDLGWRLRLAGWKNVLAPSSVVYHKYEFSRSIAKYYFMERNRYLVLLKNLRVWSLLVLAPWLVLSECALFMFALRGGWPATRSLGGGWWKEKLKVYRFFLSLDAWRYVARERKRIAALRQVGDREIVRLFSLRISYQEVATPFVRYVANPFMDGLWTLLRLLII